MPEEWRPDLSGILLYSIPSQHPDYGNDAYMFYLSRGQEHLKDMAVLGFVQNMVERRVPLYLMLELGGAKMIFMNEPLAELVARRDTNRFVSTFSAMIRDLSQTI